MAKITNSTTVACPQCGVSVLWNLSQTYRPFCSKRCQLMDYGDWATEKHSIPADPLGDEMDYDFNNEHDPNH